MDAAYDHIQEESYPHDPTKQQSGGESTHQETANNFNTEIQDAYKAISSSPWAARLGGFLGTVKKQSEQYIDTASKQYAPLTKNASAGVATFISHARNLSVQAGDIVAPPASTDKDASLGKGKEAVIDAHPDRPESLPADIVREAEGMLSRFRLEATKRLKDIEKAEDAADEALLKFGSNIRNFLSDAVTIAPPVAGSEADKNGDVLFESKDSSGKKVVHATRFDAQLHVIHSTLDSFLKDPASPEYEKWKVGFSVDGKTEAIAKDLEKHEELKRAFEKCVPERVDYGVFWERYYFLRHVIESEEQRRREMLKASTPAADEEVSWDEESDEEDEKATKVEKDVKIEKKDVKGVNEVKNVKIEKDDDDDEEEEDSDDDDDEEEEDEDEEEEEEEEDDDDDDDDDDDTSTSSEPPARPTTASTITALEPTNLAASTKTLKPIAAAKQPIKPAQPRRSNDEKSVADSDASYDLVSGATSRAPGSPQAEKKKVGAEEEESDEEDWE